jgi:hypothetical protein
MNTNIENDEKNSMPSRHCRGVEVNSEFEKFMKSVSFE